MTAVVGAAHEAGVERLLDSYRAIPPGRAVRLAKRTSNLFRARADDATRRGWTSPGLTGVIAVDPRRRTADVAGHVHLRGPRRRDAAVRADAAGRAAAEDHHPRRRGHRPRHRVDVVPQRAAARVGARDGHPHRRRRGRHRVARREHADLFRAFPNSYGTLGYAVRLRIELEPVEPFVALRHVRFHDARRPGRGDGPASSRPAAIDGVPVDYLDGVVFSADESYLVPRRADRRRPGRSATTPASRSTTARSSTPTA